LETDSKQDPWFFYIFFLGVHIGEWCISGGETLWIPFGKFVFTFFFG